MDDEAIVDGIPLAEDWVTLEQAAAVCRVDCSWLQVRIEEGLLPQVVQVDGVWKLPSPILVRIRRMCQLERNFASGPELAALVADMLEELDWLREQLRCVGQVQ